MTKTVKKHSQLTRALLETAKDMQKSGILDDATYVKITLRHLGGNAKAKIKPLTGNAIRAMREQANMSQAVFAHYLNVTVGYVSQLERGAKRATGAVLVLLNIIRSKGIEVVL